MSAAQESPELARLVAERDLYRTLLGRIARARRHEKCGYCGQPVTGPGLCGLPNTHEHEESHEH